eukprot:GAFH01005728.1.p2 GENE.GAFH01005728.1~~GAFH01005728.1.p2  ORF type:complete len:82 (-),score=10.39 GAFH01005728.1:169-414(-)
MPVHDHLVHKEVGPFEIEHNVKLAHTVEILVERLNQVVNEFEDRKLVITLVSAHNKEEGGVPAIDDTVLFELEEGTLRISS